MKAVSLFLGRQELVVPGIASVVVVLIVLWRVALGIRAVEGNWVCWGH